jgi:hypothetical protein
MMGREVRRLRQFLLDVARRSIARHAPRPLEEVCPGVCLQPGNSAGALADRRRGDVVHPGEDENEAIERAKAPAPLRAHGDQREVLSEERVPIYTGVPRAGFTPPDWKFEPNPADCAYRPPTPPPIVPAPEPPSAPAIASEPAPQWTKIQTQVTAPSEGGLGGVIAEGWFSVVGGELRVEDWRRRRFAHPIAPGDDVAALTRKALRAKFGQHHSFDQPINNPRRSYH